LITLFRHADAMLRHDFAAAPLICRRHMLISCRRDAAQLRDVAALFFACRHDTPRLLLSDIAMLL